MKHILAIAFFVLLPAARASAQVAPESSPGLPVVVETAETPTEDFANALLDASAAARAGDMAAFVAILAPELVATPFPPSEPPPRPLGPWILKRNFSAPEPRRMSREDLGRAFDAFLSLHATVEDVLFKVKSSAVDVAGASLRALLRFSVIGRDSAGRRQWTRGEASVRAVRSGDAGFRIESFVIGDMGALVAGREAFTEVAREAGVNRTDPPFAEKGSTLVVRGAAAADVDRDGLVDLFVTGEEGNALYRNLGDGRFRDIAGDANVRLLAHPGMAPVFLDMDNDGDLDLFISTIGTQVLFENRLVPDGKLEFEDVSVTAGVDRPAVGYSAAAADIDGNGLPDIHVASYNRYGEVVPDDWNNARNGTPNLLFLNLGNGRFRECAAALGLDDRRWSYAAAFADVDRDGRMDLYVANDFGGGNSLRLNRDGRFAEAPADAGAADRGFGMGVAFGDYDNDGHLDIHIAQMSSTAGRRILARIDPRNLGGKPALEKTVAGNVLLRNRGDGRFEDVSGRAGPFGAGWAWGGGFIDIDNDGFQDVHTPNGFISGRSPKDT